VIDSIQSTQLKVDHGMHIPVGAIALQPGNVLVTPLTVAVASVKVIREV
jgi:hypothetical protein